jgi:hypothetical protein
MRRLVSARFLQKPFLSIPAAQIYGFLTKFSEKIIDFSDLNPSFSGQNINILAQKKAKHPVPAAQFHHKNYIFS